MLPSPHACPGHQHVKPDTRSSTVSPFNRRAQHDAKRTAILSVAAKLFNSRGARATTLQDVARELGLTKTSLYYYVKTKEELVFLCYEAALQRYNALMDTLDTDVSSPLERARLFFHNAFERWLLAQEGAQSHQAALLELASLKSDHRQKIAGEYIRMFKRLRGYLKDAIAEGEVRECETISTTRAMIGAHDWVFHWLHQVHREDVLKTAEEAWDILLNGFYPGPGYYRPEPITPTTVSSLPAHGFDRDERNRQKQEAFYKAGTWFFNRKGFSGASLDEIAEHLDVSKGAFYYHIKNKEDLLYACYERSIAITDRIHKRAARGDGSGLEKLDETARRIFHAQNSDEGPLIRFSSITALPPPRRRAILAATEETNISFEKFLQAGVADGSARTVNAMVARNLMAGATNAAMDITLWRRVDDMDLAAIDYFDVFYNGLLPRKEAP